MERSVLTHIHEARAHHQLAKGCRRVLAALEPPRPFDMLKVLKQYSEYTGRPLHLMAYPFKASAPFAVWIRADTGVDYVFHSSAAEPEHHITLLAHEFGHMLGGHKSGGHSRHLPAPLVRELFRPERYPDLNVDRWIANPSMYGTREEREAEFIAKRVRQWSRIVDQVAVNHSGDPTLDAITATLADHRGWL